MSKIKTNDGTEIFYKDWGSGQPIIFSHGWPLSGDAWDSQMLFFGQRGYRVIAHDRRGHGRSDQPWHGYTMEQFGDDLADLINTIDLRGVVLVAHSMGGGEVSKYISRHGTSRLAKVVLVSAVPPLMLKTAANPHGTPLSAFDAIRDGLAENRAQFFKDLTLPFFGYNREGAKVSEGIRESFWLQGNLSAIKAVYDCVKQFSEIDFTEDLKKFDVPTLIVHGDDDQIVPIEASAHRSSKLAPKATLKVYAGAPHGLPITHHEQLNADILTFIRG